VLTLSGRHLHAAGQGLVRCMGVSKKVCVILGSGVVGSLEGCSKTTRTSVCWSRDGTQGSPSCQRMIMTLNCGPRGLVHCATVWRLLRRWQHTAETDTLHLLPSGSTRSYALTKAYPCRRRYKVSVDTPSSASVVWAARVPLSQHCTTC
jgi:hypothetical protein